MVSLRLPNGPSRNPAVFCATKESSRFPRRSPLWWDWNQSWRPTLQRRSQGATPPFDRHDMSRSRCFADKASKRRGTVRWTISGVDCRCLFVSLALVLANLLSGCGHQRIGPSAESPKTYETRGVVREIKPDGKTVV